MGLLSPFLAFLATAFDLTLDFAAVEEREICHLMRYESVLSKLASFIKVLPELRLWSSVGEEVSMERNEEENEAGRDAFLGSYRSAWVWTKMLVKLLVYFCSNTLIFLSFNVFGSINCFNALGLVFRTAYKKFWIICVEKYVPLGIVSLKFLTFGQLEDGLFMSILEMDKNKLFETRHIHESITSGVCF